jgi:hypothetical protein
MPDKKYESCAVLVPDYKVIREIKKEKNYKTNAEVITFLLILYADCKGIIPHSGCDL